MSEPAPSPSLIQQRMALQRKRALAIVLLVSQTLLAVGWVVQVLTGTSDWARWSMLAVLGIAIGGTLIALVKVLRDTRAFNERYGRDAGVQEPVT